MVVHILKCAVDIECRLGCLLHLSLPWFISWAQSTYCRAFTLGILSSSSLMCFYRLGRLIKLISHYGGLREQTYIPHPPYSLLVSLKTFVFTLNMKHASSSWIVHNRLPIWLYMTQNDQTLGHSKVRKTKLLFQNILYCDYTQIYSRNAC